MTLPFVFQPTRNARLVGILGYGFAALLVIVLAGFVVLATATSLGISLGLERTVAQIVGGVAAVVLGFVVAWATVCDYRFHYYGKVTCNAEQITVPSRRGDIVIPVEEVDAVSLRRERDKMSVVLSHSNGKRTQLPAKFACFDETATVIRTLIAPVILKKWSDRVQSGLTVVVGERKLSAGLRYCQGWSLFPIAILCFLSIKGIPQGMRIFRESREFIHTGWRGITGNLSLDAQGLQQRGRFFPWTAVTSIEDDDFGCRINSTDGDSIWVSLYADNFLVLLRYVATKCDEH